MSLADRPSDANAGSGACPTLTSPEVYDVLREHGVRPDSRVLDLAAGVGDAAQTLTQGGATVTPLAGSPEALPFAGGAFDAAIAPDVFHRFLQRAAFAELLRVVRTGGLVAVWWTAIASDGEIAAQRAAATRDAGFEPIPDPLARGFRAFYAAPFSVHALRVVPAVVEASVSGWMTYERSRPDVAAVYGKRAPRWHDALEARLLGAYGAPEARMRVPLFQYVYLGTV